MFEYNSAYFLQHKTPLVKLNLVLWSTRCTQGSEGCSHHISVGTAIGKQQRGEEWQRPSWDSETQESQDQLRTCVSLQFDAQEIRTVGMNMTEFTLRPETCLCFNCFYCLQISHEWRRRPLLVVILFILWGVLLSCDILMLQKIGLLAAALTFFFFFFFFCWVAHRSSRESMLYRCCTE